MCKRDVKGAPDCVPALAYIAPRRGDAMHRVLACVNLNMHATSESGRLACFADQARNLARRSRCTIHDVVALRAPCSPICSRISQIGAAAPAARQRPPPVASKRAAGAAVQFARQRYRRHPAQVATTAGSAIRRPPPRQKQGAKPNAPARGAAVQFRKCRASERNHICRLYARNKQKNNEFCSPRRNTTTEETTTVPQCKQGRISRERSPIRCHCFGKANSAGRAEIPPGNP